MSPDRWLTQILERADPEGYLAFIVCTGRGAQFDHPEEIVGVLFDRDGGMQWGPRTIYLSEDGTHARILITSWSLFEDETTTPEEAEKIRELRGEGSRNIDCPGPPLGIGGCHWRIPEERWEGALARLAKQPAELRPRKVNIADMALRRGETGN